MGALVLVGTVAAVAVALVVHVSPWLTRGFGVSTDGFNASFWALGARGARADPIGNRLGGIHPGGYAYANHPPLVVWITTLTGAISDEEPLVLRLPALTASLASTLLLARLLLDAGLRRVHVAAGLAVAGTTAMFLTFGAMLDTPVVGLPFGLAAVMVAQRAWQGRTTTRPAWSLVIGMAAGLAAWQAALITVLAVTAALVSPAGRRNRAVRALAVGLAVGLIITGAWVLWTYGGVAELVDMGRQRSGPALGFLDRQQLYALDLYGITRPVVVVLGLIAAVLFPRRLAGSSAEDRHVGDERLGGDPAWRGPRPLAVVVAATVGLYALAFREGATVHEYWTYWAVAVVALGAAVLVATISDLLSRVSPPLRRLGHGALVLAVVAVAIRGTAQRSAADRFVREGTRAVPVLARAPRASEPEQVTLAVRTDFGVAAPWANFATHGQVAVPTDSELMSLPPDELLFLDMRPERPNARMRAAAVAVDGYFVLLRADDYQRIAG